ncbi:MAG: hypothetical protein N2652_06960 [Kiritimatiellae bacterium]|nr:hypothetical protein [Kiritimatiellia bacterium]
MKPRARTERRQVEWQGIVFAYGLTRHRLILALFRLLPVAWVRYEHIVYIRQRSVDDLKSALVPGRGWYWPHAWFLGRADFDHAPYVIRTRAGRQIFVRLRHGFHYLLRDRVGEARAAAQATTANGG